jgi:ribosome-binding factor A
MANTIRLKRISDRIREDLSRLLIRQVADPRLTAVTITDVKVDRELAYADIFVSSWEGPGRSEEVIKALRHASGFLRTELAALVDLRSMPRLRFHWDPTPDHADHIEKLLLELRIESSSPEEQSEEQPADLSQEQAEGQADEQPRIEEDEADDDE